MMEIIAEFSKRAKYLEARKLYGKYRQRRKESKIYIAMMFAMCEGVCPVCERKMILSFDDIENRRGISATLDHTTPLSYELEHKKSGLEIMCKECNHRKGNTLSSLKTNAN